MLFRQLKYVPGLQPNDESMLYAMLWAVPGSGGGAAATVAAVPPEVPPAACSGCAATLGAPTRCMECDAADRTIICWRCCSSTATAWLLDTAAAAMAAPELGTLPGRIVTRKPAMAIPVTGVTAGG